MKRESEESLDEIIADNFHHESISVERGDISEFIHVENMKETLPSKQSHNVVRQKRVNKPSWDDTALPPRLKGMTKKERRNHILCFVSLIYCIIVLASVFYVALFYEGATP